MEPLLISNEDCAPYVELPENIRQARLDSHIRRAQRRFKPLLGEALYTELLRRVQVEQLALAARAEAKLLMPDALDADLPALAPLTGDWLALRTEAVPALANATLAQYWPFSQTTVTGTSIVRKTSPYSEPVSDRTLATQASIFDGEALSYEVELRTWLIANATRFASFYPDASHCGTQPAPGRAATVVVQAIRRLR